MNSRPSAGFSLVELLVGLAIFSTLLTLAFPVFTVYMQNARVLAMAEGFASGLQLARTEAVRRNTQTQFVVLAAGTPATAASKDVAAGDVAGKSWIVRSTTATAGIFDFVGGKDVQEGTGATVAVASGAAIVTFTSLGASTLGATTLFQFTSATGLVCEPSGDIRCMNVRVSPGGHARLCDPAVASAADSRSC